MYHFAKPRLFVENNSNSIYALNTTNAIYKYTTIGNEALDQKLKLKKSATHDLTNTQNNVCTIVADKFPI